MALVDTHCHLHDAKFDEDREAVRARALDTVDWLITIADDLPTSHAAQALAGDRVYATVGVHPYHAESVTEECIEQLRGLAGKEGVVGIGEIGLDYYHDHFPHDVQAAAFRKQMALAAELKLPVVIHNRDADTDTFAILQEYVPSLPACIMHCFGSTPEFAVQCVSLGCYISFAGNVVFPSATQLREAVKAIPLAHLLVETDAPYLSPPPMRGKRCEPAFVMYTAQTLAVVKGIPIGDLTRTTTSNACRAFNVPDLSL